MKKERIILSVLILTILFTIPSFGNTPFKMEDSSENLKLYMEKLQLCIKTGDIKNGASMTKALIPDSSRIAYGLNKKVTKETKKAIADFFKKVVPNDPKKVSQLFKTNPKRTQVLVHRAKGTEIAKNEKGSIVWKEFPGGAVSAAKKYLNPKLYFYEIELLEPGDSRGTKYHLFYFDGKNWTMFGPLWRSLK